MNDTMKIPARMCLVAENVEFRAKRTEKETTTRKFTMVAYSGGPVHDPFVDQLIVDVEQMKLRDKRMPILLSHDYTAPAGFADRGNIDTQDGQVRITGQLIESFPAGGTILAGADNEFTWQASIGFQIDAAEFIEKGQSRDVNGREFKGPGVVVTKSTLIETSFVPAGADGNTTATVFARADRDAGEITVTRSHTMSETDTKTGQMSAADIDEQKEAAAESGRQEERARLVALKGAFPDRIGFAVEQYEAGHTVEQARAALAGVLATELSAANAKVDELSKTNAELSGKLQAFEDGAAGAGQSKTGETGGGGGDGKYDGNWDSRLSDEELAREHLAKNFDGCKEQFDGETGFANYVQFVGEERRIAAGG